LAIQRRKEKEISKDREKCIWFFDWDEAGTFRNKGRSHSIISELYLTAQRERIVINYDTKNNSMAIWVNEDKSTMKQCKKEKQLKQSAKFLKRDTMKTF
jgi:ribosomal protein L14E/L6E/L27E